MARKNTRRGHPEPKLHVIYEQVPNPDSVAVKKAFEMLFGAMPNQPPAKLKTVGWRRYDHSKRPKPGEQQALPF
jgi:hypothetical protein